MIAFFGILLFGVVFLGGAAVIIHNADKNQRQDRATDTPAGHVAKH